MTSHIETLLRVHLAQGANYKQKQLLKSGNLGTVAVAILESRRKRLRRLTFALYGFLLLPLALELVSSLLWSEPPHVGLFCILGLGQLPVLIEQRAQISRLETLIAMWFLTEEDTNKETAAKDAALLQMFGPIE